MIPIFVLSSELHILSGLHILLIIPIVVPMW